MSRFVSVAAAAVFAVAGVGCAGEIAPASKVQLELRGEDGRLTLRGSPLDPGYQASYSNPRGIDSMQVTLDRDGRLRGACRSGGAEVSCGDVPFYAKVTLQGDRRVVKAWDLHGKQVVEVVFDDVGAGGDQGCQGEDDVGADDCSTDDDDDSDGDDDGDDDGDGDSPPPECPPPPAGDDCAAIESWARDCFCTVVQANLDAYGVAYSLDCSGLDSDTEFPEVDTDYEGEIACRDDLVEDGEDAVDPVVEGCPAAEVAVSNWASQADYVLRSQGYCGHSPLVLDLGGDGVALGDVAGGVSFDLLGDGAPVSCAWLAGADDAFLVQDLDADGTVSGGRELFGQATAGAGFSDGFAALAALDENRDGVIDAADPGWASLRLWSDRDRDGVGPAWELSTLAEAGVTSLSLDAETRRGAAAWDGRGNRVPLVSSFERADGTRAALVDAFLAWRR